MKQKNSLKNKEMCQNKYPNFVCANTDSVEIGSYYCAPKSHMCKKAKIPDVPFTMKLKYIVEWIAIIAVAGILIMFIPAFFITNENFLNTSISFGLTVFFLSGILGIVIGLRKAKINYCTSLPINTISGYIDITDLKKEDPFFNEGKGKFCP